MNYISKSGKEYILPDEYEGKVDFSKYDSNIEKSFNFGEKNNDIFRFLTMFKNFLSKKYKGDLPKDIISLARYLEYDDHLIALFTMSENQYKATYPNEYADFFANKSAYERNKLFYIADCGRRTIFELEQDTVASNILEDMIVYHSRNIFTANKDASGRCNSKVTTKCDLIFEKLTSNEYIRIPIELKTKWKGVIENKVSIRGNANNICNEYGMILVIFANLKGQPVKYGLVDSYNAIFTKGEYIAGKDCENVEMKDDDIKIFEFWKNESMKRLILDILDKYRARKNINNIN